jgi:hypothetical protein
MKFEPRPFADPDTAARKLVEIANGVEAVLDGRIISSASARRLSRQATAETTSAPGSRGPSRRAGYGGTRARRI